MSVDEKRLDSANFELIDAEKEFLKNICKTVNDFDSNDKKDEAFWRDFFVPGVHGSVGGRETWDGPMSLSDSKMWKEAQPRSLMLRLIPKLRLIRERRRSICVWQYRK